MTAQATGTAYIGPIRTSLGIGDDTTILVEQNGVIQSFEKLAAPGSRHVHLISPLRTGGSFDHNGQKVGYMCEIMPDFKPGMSLSKFVKAVSETLQAKIDQKATFRIPQLFELIVQEGKHTETLDTKYGDMPYKLTYSYKI